METRTRRSFNAGGRMSELKPCPFNPNHGTEWLEIHCKGEYLFWVECSKHSEFANQTTVCCQGPKRELESEAIESWNTRPFEAHAVEVLAEALCNKDGPTTGLFWSDASVNTKQHYRSQARELLGRKDNNNKEAQDEQS